MESVARKRKLREVNKNVPLPAREAEIKRFRRSYSKENVKIFQDDNSDSKKSVKNIKRACDEKNAKSSTCDEKTDKLSTWVDRELLQTTIPPIESGDKLSDLSCQELDNCEDSESDNYDSDSESTLEPDEDLSSSEADSTLKSVNQEFIEDVDSTITENESSVSEASVKTELIVSQTESKGHGFLFSDNYLEDIIFNELQKESQYFISDDYCSQYEINPDRRETLVDWLIYVQGSVKAGNTMIHIAVALLDILLDRVPVHVKDLQACAIAAFWVAYKFIHGTLEVKTMIELCDGNVTKEMILRYEMLVLSESNAIQTGGDVLVFFNYFLYKIYGCPFPNEIYYGGQYFLEIMLLHVEFVNCSSSQKAIAAVVAANHIFPANSPTGKLNVFKFIRKNELDIIHRHLLSIIKSMYGNENDLHDCAVYKKYRSSKYCKISLHGNFKKLVKS